MTKSPIGEGAIRRIFVSYWTALVLRAPGQFADDEALRRENRRLCDSIVGLFGTARMYESDGGLPVFYTDYSYDEETGRLFVADMVPKVAGQYNCWSVADPLVISIDNRLSVHPELPSQLHDRYGIPRVATSYLSYLGKEEADVSPIEALRLGRLAFGA